MKIHNTNIYLFLGQVFAMHQIHLWWSQHFSRHSPAWTNNRILHMQTKDPNLTHLYTIQCKHLTRQSWFWHRHSIHCITIINCIFDLVTISMDTKIQILISYCMKMMMKKMKKMMNGDSGRLVSLLACFSSSVVEGMWMQSALIIDK